MPFNPLSSRLVTAMSEHELCAMIDDINVERRFQAGLDYDDRRHQEVDREDSRQRNEAGNDGAC